MADTEKSSDIVSKKETSLKSPGSKVHDLQPSIYGNLKAPKGQSVLAPHFLH